MSRMPLALVAALSITACAEPATMPTGAEAPSLAPRPSTGIVAIDLGSPTSHLGSSDAGSVARAVNTLGVAVGYAGTKKFEPGSFLHPMRWTINADGTVRMENLMPALGLAATTDAMALGINDAGVIIGVFSPTDGARQHGFALEPSGMTDVNDLPLCSGEPIGGDESTVRDINNLGEVVGWRRTSETASIGFVLSLADRCLVALPTLGEWAQPIAINDASVIAGSSGGASGVRNVLWIPSADGGWMIRELGDESAQIGGISMAGDVAGMLRIPSSSGGYHQMAFAWIGPAATPTTLGTLGGLQSAAYDISPSGRIVGWAHNKQQYMRPFLLTSSGMLDLGTLGGPTGSANGISGAWIVGNSELFTKGRETTGHATAWKVP